MAGDASEWSAHAGELPDRPAVRDGRAENDAAAFESSDGLVLLLDPAEHLLHASDRWEQLFSTPLSEAIGRPLFSALRGDRAQIAEGEEFVRIFRAALHSGPDVPIPLRVKSSEARNGAGVELEGRAYPRRDGSLVVFHSISDSDRKPAPPPDLASRDLDEEHLRTEKLETLGVLAAGVAHDFSNLLTPILGNASLLLADLPTDAPERRWAEAIRRAASRASALTAQMLAYAGNGEPCIARLDISAVIRDLTLLLETTASKRCRLELELADGLPLIHGDRSQITQIVVSLVAAASDAIGETPGARTSGPGGHIIVRTSLTHASREDLDACRLGSGLSPGDYVLVEVMNRLVDPTDREAKGHSQRTPGLSVVLGVLRAHGGALGIEDNEGSALSHRVLLPLARA